MSRQMFVWRMARDHSAGDPWDHTPANGDSSQVHRKIRNTGQVHIDYPYNAIYKPNARKFNNLRSLHSANKFNDLADK
jgi:hypothetical protein